MAERSTEDVPLNLTALGALAVALGGPMTLDPTNLDELAVALGVHPLAPAMRGLTIAGEAPVPLRTGQRRADQSRADHAGGLRVARLRRRVARRRGRPVATVTRTLHFPAVALTGEPTKRA